MERITVQDYLDRIGYMGPLAPTAENLRALAAAHVAAVPFDNLDMLAQKPLNLTQEALWDKIVVRRRGGVCHELNNAFRYLLQALGYEVELRSAPVHDPNDRMAHVNLWVTVDGALWLVDVGFGDQSIPVLPLDGPEGEGYGGRYRFEPRPDGTTALLFRRTGEEDYAPLYVCYPDPRQPEDAMGSYAAQAAPGASIFSTYDVVILTTQEARYALVKHKLTTTPHGGGAPTVRPIPDGETRKQVLRDYFGITLP